MRAMSWYQQQGKNMKCDHRRDSQGHCVFDCDCQEGCSEHERCAPKATLQCVSFVPARAAYNKIIPGTLYGNSNSPVHITSATQSHVVLSVGYKDAGAWSKIQLKELGETLLKLSEYMES